jgi:hypothetical protein
MTIDAWVEAAVADAERRGLPELRPLIEALAQATRALRAADLTRQEPLPTPRGTGLSGSRGLGLSGSRRAGLSGPPNGQ